MQLDQIIDFSAHPLSDAKFRTMCRKEIDDHGVLVLPNFMTPSAIDAVHAEGEASRDLVYASTETHTVYLSPVDRQFAAEHPRNTLVTSSKGCLTDDQLPAVSPLRSLYKAPEFRDFLCDVVGEQELHAYRDPLSSINLHFAETGQELGWHFDNSSFATTLMIQPPTSGGQFEYVTDVRDADRGEMNFAGVADVLDGRTPVKHLTLDAGALVIFRGRNALHRVAPNLGHQTRILAVLAYNTEPGIALSEEARMTFYGRTS